MGAALWGVVVELGRLCSLCLRGKAVVKETVKVREVRDICKHHVAR